MVNYYELLNITKDAQRIEIEQAIKKTRRLWNNRSNNPDAAIRAEAEQHVREVAEAETILLDPKKREEYDWQLSNAPVNYEEPQNQGIDGNWENQYFQAYDNGMNDYAAQIAGNVVNAQPNNGRAWFLLGEAQRRMEDYQNAIPALRRAAMLIKDEGVHRQLAFAYMDTGRYYDAINELVTATNLAPDVPEFYALRASCYRQVNNTTAAIREATAAFEMDPHDDIVRFEMFTALYADAEDAMAYNRSSGKHLIINRKQLDYVNAILKKMAQTIPNDVNKRRCTEAMERVVQIAADAESIKGGSFFRAGKIGYEYNYEISNNDTRRSGLH